MTTEELKKIEELANEHQKATRNRDEAAQKLASKNTTLEDFNNHNYWGIETAKLRNKLVDKVPLLLAEIKDLKAQLASKQAE